MNGHVVEVASKQYLDKEHLIQTLTESLFSSITSEMKRIYKSEMDEYSAPILEATIESIKNDQDFQDLLDSIKEEYMQYYESAIRESESGERVIPEEVIKNMPDDLLMDDEFVADIFACDIVKQDKIDYYIYLLNEEEGMFERTQLECHDQFISRLKEIYGEKEELAHIERIRKMAFSDMKKSREEKEQELKFYIMEDEHLEGSLSKVKQLERIQENENRTVDE